MTTKEQIAGRLREARRKAGLTQEAAAKALGMVRPTVSEIEAGRRNVRADELAAFAGLYESDVRWLCGFGE